MNIAKTLAVSAVAGMLMGSAVACGGSPTPDANAPAAGGKSSCSAGGAAPAGSGKSSCSAAGATGGKASCSAAGAAGAAPAPKY